MLSSFNASDSVSVVVDVVQAGFLVSVLLRGFFLRKSSGVPEKHRFKIWIKYKVTGTL